MLRSSTSKGMVVLDGQGFIYRGLEVLPIGENAWLVRVMSELSQTISQGLDVIDRRLLHRQSFLAAEE